MTKTVKTPKCETCQTETPELRECAACNHAFCWACANNIPTITAPDCQLLEIKTKCPKCGSLNIKFI